jgi:hypothetical protein
MKLFRMLRKEVEIGANGTQKYTIKKDLTKVRLYDSYASFYDYSWLFNYWFSLIIVG